MVLMCSHATTKTVRFKNKEQSNNQEVICVLIGKSIKLEYRYKEIMEGIREILPSLLTLTQQNY